MDQKGHTKMAKGPMDYNDINGVEQTQTKATTVRCEGPWNATFQCCG
jgi:hypothetical protein